jgi:hypothetical protein
MVGKRNLIVADGFIRADVMVWYGMLGGERIFNRGVPRPISLLVLNFISPAPPSLERVLFQLYAAHI